LLLNSLIHLNSLLMYFSCWYCTSFKRMLKRLSL
jgi:hypothetical protein